MPSPAPAPRLPIEPGERPLYRIEPRLGCSPVSIVSVVALFAFVFFFFRVAPGIVQSVQQFSLPRLLGIESAQPNPTPEEVSGLTTALTPIPALEFTPTIAAAGPPQPSATPYPTTGPAVIDPTFTPAPTATAVPTPPLPAAEYVQVGNTEGTGVYLRATPARDARRLIGLTDQTVLLVVGPNVQGEGMEWRNVQTTKGEQLTGYILTIYLLPASAP